MTDPHELARLADLAAGDPLVVAAQALVGALTPPA